MLPPRDAVPGKVALRIALLRITLQRIAMGHSPRIDCHRKVALGLLVALGIVAYRIYVTVIDSLKIDDMEIGIVRTLVFPVS